MTILDLLIAIAICGFILWLILQIPMPQVFKNIIMGIACLGLILYVLQGFGLWHGFNVRLK